MLPEGDGNSLKYYSSVVSRTEKIEIDNKSSQQNRASMFLNCKFYYFRVAITIEFVDIVF
jgi:hypothetical protein